MSGSDTAGQRSAAMTQSELIEQLIEVFGSEQRLADAIPPAGRRVVLRWANGSQPVPVGVWLAISSVLQGRRAELERLLRSVGEHAKAASDQVLGG